MSIDLGIMQGRLSTKLGQKLQSFPYNEWKEEFRRAKDFNFQYIELLLDDFDDKENPITTQIGRKEILKISKINAVDLKSICAHSFIKNNFFSKEENNSIISNLVNVCKWAKELDISNINIPIEVRQPVKYASFENIKKIFELIKIPKSINLLIEIDLNGRDTIELLKIVDNDQINLLYDLGNANALKFDIMNDLEILYERIFEIHLKDRSFKDGKSYQLGSGNTPFSKIANKLGKLNWKGLVVLETPIYSDWEREVEINSKFATNWINKIRYL